MSEAIVSLTNSNSSTIPSGVTGNLIKAGHSSGSIDNPIMMSDNKTAQYPIVTWGTTFAAKAIIVWGSSDTSHPHDEILLSSKTVVCGHSPQSYYVYATGSYDRIAVYCQLTRQFTLDKFGYSFSYLVVGT